MPLLPPDFLLVVVYPAEGIRAAEGVAKHGVVAVRAAAAALEEAPVEAVSRSASLGLEKVLVDFNKWFFDVLLRYYLFHYSGSAGRTRHTSWL